MNGPEQISVEEYRKRVGLADKPLPERVSGEHVATSCSHVPAPTSIRKLVKLRAFGKPRPRGFLKIVHPQVKRMYDSLLNQCRLLGLPKPFVSTYMPGDYREWQKQLRAAVREVPQGIVELALYATRRMPASWSRVQRESMRGRLCTSKPDRDNAVGAVMDTLFREVDKEEREALEAAGEEVESGDSRVAVISRVEYRWWDYDSLAVVIKQVVETELNVWPWLEREKPRLFM